MKILQVTSLGDYNIIILILLILLIIVDSTYVFVPILYVSVEALKFPIRNFVFTRHCGHMFPNSLRAAVFKINTLVTCIDKSFSFIKLSE